MSKSKQGFPPEVWDAGMEGSWCAGAAETLAMAIMFDYE